jgi:hypothetical protein
LIAPLPNRGAVEEDYYDIADLPVDQFRPRDPAIDKAIERLDTFFKDAPQRVFYSTQIETSLERDFFHWIVGKALLELATGHQITRVPVLIEGQTVNFYANRKHRYLRRQLNAMVEILRRIFDPEFAHAIGRHGELMFDARSVAMGSALKPRMQTAGTERRG